MSNTAKSATAQMREIVEGAESVDTCPVTALGESVEGGRFFFLSRSGKVRVFTHRDMSKSGIDSLFVGHTDWLVKRHPHLDRKGEPTDDWNPDQARSDLLRRCDFAGYFDPDKRIRGPGTWRDDEGGLIVHCGDRVLQAGQWRDAGFIDDEYVYPRFPKIMQPPAKPASEADAANLLTFLQEWNWQWAEGAPRAVFGYIFSAMICGAIDWRPHIWIVGGGGRGKTTLQSTISGILGAMLVRASDPSAVGVRNRLNSAALPVALDEMEFDPKNNRASECVNLARLGSSDDQPPTLRGDPAGGTHQWVIRSCFCFSSIVHAPLKQQDRGRITVVRLDKLGKSANKRYVLDQIDRFTKLGPAFHARMIAGYDRFRENLLTFEEALSADMGYRVSDQFGTMMAAAETMLSDEPISIEAATRLLAEMDLETNIDDDGIEECDECLARLMSWPADLWDSGSRQTMGSLVEIAAGRLDGHGDTRKRLPALGLKLWPAKGKPEYLAISRHHENINRVFKDTRFEQGGWIQFIKEFAPDAETPTINFAGAYSRAQLVPLSVVWPDSDDDPPAPPLVD